MVIIMKKLQNKLNHLFFIVSDEGNNYNKIMNHQDLFSYYENLNANNNRRITSSRNGLLNPWSENQSVNPYLNVPSKMPKLKSNAQSLKKIQNKEKSVSLNQSKSTYHLGNHQQKQSSDLNKISKQLPKLNICHGIKNQTFKKKKLTQQFSKRYVMNSSPLYFSSPTLNKNGIVHNSQQFNKKSKIFPAVSRELDVTRKIFLLQNKMNSTSGGSPQRKSTYFLRQQGDIRRLVQKQWAKKI